jgi:signal transduction histidine kinase
LDLAAFSLRPQVLNADAARLRAEIPRMQRDLAPYGVSVAAFDARGTFLGGAPEVHADGALADNPRPSHARQVAVVPGASSYLVLAVQPRARAPWRQGAVLIGILLTIAAVLAGWFAGLRIAALRLRGVDAVRRRLAGIGAGEAPLATALRFDAETAPLEDAADAALARLGGALAERATNEERLRAFLADAGHEMRTPLAIAAGYVGVLQRGALSDPVLAEQILGEISASNTRMTALVEGMLHLARLDAVADGGGSADVSRAITEAIDLVRPLDLTRTIATDLVAGARADIAADDLRDALRNLLENAIRYAPDAPIRVTVKLASGLIDISVIDSGPGMTSFEREHAFDRFFRGAARGDITGSGLGLAIVKRIVERAGGSVILASSPSGTHVCMRVPSSPAI